MVIKIWYNFIWFKERVRKDLEKQEYNSNEILRKLRKRMDTNKDITKARLGIKYDV